jgi:hypothetical protein
VVVVIDATLKIEKYGGGSGDSDGGNDGGARGPVANGFVHIQVCGRKPTEHVGKSKIGPGHLFA